MLRVALIVGLVVVTVGLWGCPPPEQLLPPYTPPEGKDYGKPLPPETLALKISPKDYPDFGLAFDNRGTAGRGHPPQLSATSPNRRATSISPTAR